MADFGIIGGDMRSVFLARRLRGLGYGVSCAGLSREEDCVEPAEACRASHIVFPMPLAKGSLLNAPLSNRPITLAECAEAARGRRVFCGGKGGGIFENFINYAADERLLLENAVATAEGAAARYSALSGKTVWKSRFVITGYGRVARAAALLFTRMGGMVTIAARSESARMAARADGCNAVTIEGMCCALSDCDGVINTAPALIVTDKELRAMPRGAVAIDLASSPGGVDFAAALSLGIPAELALALPGRCSPATAGDIIANTILRLIKEETDE